MYTIRNVAFDEALKKYDATHVNQLSTSQLLDLCKILGTEAVWQSEKRTRVKVLTYETIDYLLSQYTRDDYMPEQYWSPEQREMMVAADWTTKMAKMERGKDVFKFYSTFKLGFVDLQPGDEVKVDYTPEYLQEMFLKRPGVSLSPESKTKYVELLVLDDQGTVLTSEFEAKVLGTTDELISLERELQDMGKEELLTKARKELGPQIKNGTPVHILRNMILKHHIK